MAGLYSLDPKFNVMIVDHGSRFLQGLDENRESRRMQRAVDLLVARTQEVASLLQQTFAYIHESNMELSKKLATMNELLEKRHLEMRQSYRSIGDAIDESRIIAEQATEQINASIAQRRALEADQARDIALHELQSKLNSIKLKIYDIKLALAQQKLDSLVDPCSASIEEQVQLIREKEQPSLQSLPVGLSTIRPIHQLLLSLIYTIFARVLFYAQEAPGIAYRQVRQIHS